MNKCLKPYCMQSNQNHLSLSLYKKVHVPDEIISNGQWIYLMIIVIFCTGMVRLTCLSMLK